MAGEEQLRLLLERAVGLIDGAGGGDWNRETAAWQLAAAQFRQQVENEVLEPERFWLEDDLTPAEACQRALGAASMCWENPGGAGVFDSDRASRIARELVSWLRRHPPDHAKDLVARAWSLLRRVPENVVLPPWEQEAHHLGVDIDAQGWFPRETPDPAQAVLAIEHPRQTADPTADTAVVAQVVEPEDPEPRRPTPYPRHEASGGYPTAPGSPDLGDDPDGDLDGYDGPMGTPGGYCTDRRPDDPPHLPGTEPDCPTCGQWQCQYNGSTAHPHGSRPGCLGCHPPMPDHGFPADQVVVPRGDRQGTEPR